MGSIHAAVKGSVGFKNKKPRTAGRPGLKFSRLGAVPSVNKALHYTSLKTIYGDVPLFVEHCEAVAAEVDVTLR